MHFPSATRVPELSVFISIVVEVVPAAGTNSGTAPSAGSADKLPPGGLRGMVEDAPCTTTRAADVLERRD